MSTSSWVYNSRRFNYDLPKTIKNLLAKFNEKITQDINANEGEELSTSSVGAPGQSFVKFCDNNLTRLDNSLTYDLVNNVIQSAPSYEPDGQYCRLLIEFNNSGGFVPDASGFDHNAHVHGIGRIWYGIEYGYNIHSLELILDGRQTYVAVHDDPDLNFMDSDFSLQFRFLPFDLRTMQFHQSTIVCKKDANNNWYSFQVDQNGRGILAMYINKKYYIITTPTNTILSTAYKDVTHDTPRNDVAITYDYINQIPLLYVNNVLYSTVSNTPDFQTLSIPDYDGTDLQIGRYTALQGKPVTLPATDEVDPIKIFSKLFFGTIQQVKFWRNKILTAAEVSSNYTNKVTISDIAFGNVAIGGSVILGIVDPAP